YGFRPMVLTSTPDGSRLSNGIPFCEVRSFITGARLISLPFSDHCQPLLNGRENTSELIGWLASECKRRKWHHVELRPLSWAMANDTSISPSQSFWFHTLSLEPSLNHIFQNLHKDSLQRRIRRAEREGLVYEKGCSEQLLDAFYGMLSLTRKRHGLPPQPKRWFHNLISFLRPNVQIRLARKDAVPI